MNTSLLTAPNPGTVYKQVRTIYILSVTPDDVAKLADAVVTVTGTNDLFAVALETSETLADVRAAVTGELGRFGRTLITAVLTTGLVLSALIVYASVTVRHQDFGRRRALGARRRTIIGIVVTQTLLITAMGVAVGAGISSGLTIWWATEPPNGAFVIAIAVLTLLTVGIAATPPALVTACHYPVHFLRVP